MRHRPPKRCDLLRLLRRLSEGRRTRGRTRIIRNKLRCLRQHSANHPVVDNKLLAQVSQLRGLLLRSLPQSSGGKKVRWWVPTLSDASKACRECGGGVPVAVLCLAASYRLFYSRRWPSRSSSVFWSFLRTGPRDRTGLAAPRRRPQLDFALPCSKKIRASLISS